MDDNSITYVLFGKEAIFIYQISLDKLLRTEDIKYDIGEFSTIKKFKEESEKWDDFIEIELEDYLKIKAHFKKKNLIQGLANKKKSFWKFFTGKS
ncbi:MAG: hypothetical protein L3J20_13485 [Flavobacteriaceae bacterium]|nr:hypothetical protein [Flavobacteriaceae bacterium]